MTAHLFSVVLCLCTAEPANDARPVDYIREIKPIFAKRCIACHGTLMQKAKLRVDTAVGLKRGGLSGAAIEPGHADESLLLDRLTAAEGYRMPPEGEPLSSDELSVIERWITQGATAPAEAPPPSPFDHWSFKPPIRSPVPVPRDIAERANPIDAFLAVRHEQQGIIATEPASKAVLLRRVSLDLTGLAPTRAEQQAFLADKLPRAYEELVERLLKSPRYGERWGRHWMDVWRYSDWAGFGQEVRESQPHIWRWRDWIIESLNADVGYDRMIVAMLAADEASPNDSSAARALGYLARSWYKFNRNVWMQDTVDHTAKAFLGLSLSCARCHDHKYDPIRQTEYYQFRAFFENEAVRADPIPGKSDSAKDAFLRVYDDGKPTPTYLFTRGNEAAPDKSQSLAPGLPRFLRELVQAPQAVKLPLFVRYPALRPEIIAEEAAKAHKLVETTQAKLEAATKSLMSSTDIAEAERAARIAMKAYVQARALEQTLRSRTAAEMVRYTSGLGMDLLAAQAIADERAADVATADLALVQANVALEKATAKTKPEQQKAFDTAKQAYDKAIAARTTSLASYSPLGPVYPETSSGRRLALAQAIANRRNPLTSRVAVNHIWTRHFGRPLVPTVADFGHNGKTSSDPALLDFLAVEFMESGWSFKHLHRMIVTSNAYKRSSVVSETTRTSAAKDPENQTYWRANATRMEAELVRDNVLHLSGGLDATTGGPELAQESAEATYRRSVYYRHAAEKKVMFLQLFDAASVVECYRRYESVLPQQALALANSPLVLSRARVLAQNISKDEKADDAFVAASFIQILGRSPEAAEREACISFLKSQAARLSDPKKLTASGGPKPAVAPAVQAADRAREDLVLVLFNHNDFVTIR